MSASESSPAESGVAWRLSRTDATIVGDRAGAGPPVVLLHGGPGLYDYCAGGSLVEWLEQSHAVWRYDQRGGGRSSTPDDLTIDAHVADLAAIREFANADRITLIGHSWGGVLACHFAATHPESVERLVLISTTGVSTDWRADFQTNLLARMNTATRLRIRALEEQIIAAPDSPDATRLHVERLNLLVPLYLAAEHRHQAPRIASFNPAAYAAGFESADRKAASAAFRNALGQLRAPVHVIHGEDDCVPMTVIDDLVAALPHTRVHRLANCGHFPWIEQPEACRRAIEAAISE